MKVRSGFVSNSSSSSFIVIGRVTSGDPVIAVRKIYGNVDTLHITPDLGCHQYGWENEEYSHFWDRVMFSFIQAEYVEKTSPKWMKMLNAVLKDKLKVNRIIWGITTKWGDDKPKETEEAYIDHQSASSEGQNIEMFESADILTHFLFGPDSYIKTGNDNE
jgi:hypothetical protein